MWFCFDLVDEGSLSTSELCAALRWQTAHRRPLGQLAVEAGMMTMARVFDVLAMQQETQQAFGQIAIELGYLTREQLGLLLLTQSETQPTVEQALVETGAMDAAGLQRRLREYRRRVGANTEQLPDVGSPRDAEGGYFSNAAF